MQRDDCQAEAAAEDPGGEEPLGQEGDSDKYCVVVGDEPNGARDSEAGFRLLAAIPAGESAEDDEDDRLYETKQGSPRDKERELDEPR